MKKSSIIIQCLVFLFLWKISILASEKIIKKENTRLENDYQYSIASRYQNPSETQLKKPVIIAVHGFSASPFEWKEFADYIKTRTNTDILVSLVQLGGHAQGYDAFKNSTWKSHGRPR